MKQLLHRTDITSRGGIKLGEFRCGRFHKAAGITDKQIREFGFCFVLRGSHAISRHFSDHQNGVGFFSTINHVNCKDSPTSQYISMMYYAPVYWLSFEAAAELAGYACDSAEVLGQNFTRIRRDLHRRFEFIQRH